jgi:hypothetical protein
LRRVRPQAAVNAPQSKRSAWFVDARPSRSVWTAVASATLFPRAPEKSKTTKKPGNEAEKFYSFVP